MGRYVLANENDDYIILKQGHSPEKTTSLSRATRFEDAATAVKRLREVPKKLGTCHPVFVDDLITVTEPNESYQELNFNEVYQRLQEDIKEIRVVMGNRKYFEQSLYKIELIKTDLEHYVEFNSLNASDGYKAYKMLHDLLVKRREVKDNIAKIEVLETSTISDIVNGNINHMDIRKYKVRNEISKPLFENKIENNTYIKVCEGIRGII